MELVPSAFFAVTGSGISGVSDLNAFDVALTDAGMGEQNLVCVSSVIPEGARLIPYRELTMGAVTHCVLAQMRGCGDETIAAGVAYAFRKDGKGGYAAEGHIHGSAESLKEILSRKMDEMGRIRGAELENAVYELRELKIPPNSFGCCVAALVFAEYRRCTD